MSDHQEHRENWIKKFIDYLANQLPGRERNAFEKRLERDEFEAEAFEGLSSLSEEELKEDLSGISARINKRSKKRIRIPYLRIAAGIAVIAVLSISYFTIFEKKIREIPENFKLGESTSSDEKQETELLTDSLKPVDEFDEKRFETRDPAPIAIIAEDKTDMKEELTENDAVAEMAYLDMDESEAVEMQTDEAVSSGKSMNTKNEFAVAEKMAKPAAEVSSDFEDFSKSAPLQREKVMAKKSDTESSNIIKGKVISGEDSLPVPGASIMIRGLASGTLTDRDGNFEIQKTGGEETLVVSMIGMNTKEINVPESGIVDISLEPDALSMDEIVVLGYGERSSAQPSVAYRKQEKDEPATLNNYSGAIPVLGFPGFKEYITQSMEFPENQQDIDRAIVILKFTVSKEGVPLKIRIIKSPAESFSKEAIRLLQEGPDWIPATQNGIYLDEETRLRLVFKREKN